jgi:hypothetical protein
MSRFNALLEPIAREIPLPSCFRSRMADHRSAVVERKGAPNSPLIHGALRLNHPYRDRLG